MSQLEPQKWGFIFYTMRRARRIQYTDYTSREQDTRWLACAHRRIKVEDITNNRRLWTSEDKQYIKDNVTDKHSLLAIATHLKRTVIAVEGMVNKLKLKLTERKEKPNKWLEATIIRMQELIKLCETTDNLYIKEKAKKELYTLSFKRSSWGGYKMPYKYRNY